MDRFKHRTSSLEGLAEHGFVITPDSARDLPETTRAIYVGGEGALAVRLRSGAELVLEAVPAGTILPIRATRVLGETSASALVGLS